MASAHGPISTSQRVSLALKGDSPPMGRMRRGTYPPFGRLWHGGVMNVPEPVDLSLADGRTLEIYVAGPADGLPLVYHNGSPSSGRPYAPFVDLAAERGLRLITYSRAGYSRSTRNPGRSAADAAGDLP